MGDGIGGGAVVHEGGGEGPGMPGTWKKRFSRRAQNAIAGRGWGTFVKRVAFLCGRQDDRRFFFLFFCVRLKTVVVSWPPVAGFGCLNSAEASGPRTGEAAKTLIRGGDG